MAHVTATTAPDQDVWNGGVSPMGASYGKLMMWFFLLSDAFTFSGLLVTYGFVRSSHQSYQGATDVFKFSHDYWPIPERVFESVPFLHGVLGHRFHVPISGHSYFHHLLFLYANSHVYLL